MGSLEDQERLDVKVKRVTALRENQEGTVSMDLGDKRESLDSMDQKDRQVCFLRLKTFQ